MRCDGDRHGQLEPAKDSLATVVLGAAVIVCTGALAAWGAWTRTGASPEQIRQTAEADLRSGRYKQAEAALERIRDLTPRDYFLKAQAARGLRRPDQVLAELAKIPDDHPAAARRACWPGRSSCDGTASAWRAPRCNLRWRGPDARAGAQGAGLHRRDTAEPTRAQRTLPGFSAAGADDVRRVIFLVPYSQHRLGAVRVRPGTQAVRHGRPG